MSLSPRVTRSLLSSAVILTLACSPRSSAAQEERRQQCIQAYESGQRLKKAGALLEAESRLAFCANNICPALMREDCALRLGEVKAALPSILLAVKFKGTPVAVRVSIDGQARAWAEDAASLDVNPGHHELRVEAAGLASQTISLLLGEGEQGVSVEVAFGAAPQQVAPRASVEAVAAEPPATPPAASFPTTAVLVTASSVVGASGLIYFGLTARHRENELAAQCAPECSSAQVNEVRRDYLLANVGLALGLASLAAGGILFWVHAERAPATAAPGARLGFEVSPAYIGAVGAF